MHKSQLQTVPIMSAQNGTEKFDFLRKRALELGAADAKIFPANHVVVEDRVVLKCKIGCNNYGKTLACPPYTPKFSGADIYSSLRMPSGVASLVTLEPEGAAIAAAKIFAVEDKELEQRVRDYQAEKKKGIETADEIAPRVSIVYPCKQHG